MNSPTEPASFYPPAPAGVPADLARPSLRYRLLVVAVLLSLFLFLFLYLSLLAGSLYLMYWAVGPAAAASARAAERWDYLVFLALLRASVFGAALMLAVFLLKGLFKREDDPSAHYVEVTEPEQPELFAFLRCLCQEIRCPFPARVCLNHDVNAAVFYPISVLQIVSPPQKSLLLGLGLVHALNLVEFKALLAHEFGHFSQRSLRLGSYVVLVRRALYSMVYVRDRWDNWVLRGFDTPWVSVFAVPLYAFVESLRAVLVRGFRVLDRGYLALCRQMEFNADLVAVGAAGSDAPVHVLFKSEFCEAARRRASQDLALAAEHRHFTRDLTYHIERAGASLREELRKPDLGRLPALPADPGLSVEVFTPEDAATAVMWADHPSHYDRERNAKRRYFRSPVDERPAWILLRDQEALRAEVTRRFYHVCLDTEPAETLADPESVHTFLEDERASVTLHPRFQGVYDRRLLELEDLGQILRDAESCPGSTSEELYSSLRELYGDGLAAWVAEYWRRNEEYSFLQGLPAGCRDAGGNFEFRGQRYPLAIADTFLEKVRSELDEDRRYLARFDRTVLTLHYRLAEHLEERQEFRRRYDFHLELEGLLKTLWGQQARVESAIQLISSRKQLEWSELYELTEGLSQERDGLAAVLARAAGLSLPPLKHLPAGEPLGSLLPIEVAVPGLETALALNIPWIEALQNQLVTVITKLLRIHQKSLVGILAFQEQLAGRCQEQSGSSQAASAPEGDTA